MVDLSKLNPEKRDLVIKLMRDGNLSQKDVKEAGLNLTEAERKALNDAFGAGALQIGDTVLVNKGRKVNKENKTMQHTITRKYGDLSCLSDQAALKVINAMNDGILSPEEAKKIGLNLTPDEYNLINTQLSLPGGGEVRIGKYILQNCGTPNGAKRNTQYHVINADDYNGQKSKHKMKSGRYITYERDMNGKETVKYYAADGTELKKEYFYKKEYLPSNSVPTLDPKTGDIAFEVPTQEVGALGVICAALTLCLSSCTKGDEPKVPTEKVEDAVNNSNGNITIGGNTYILTINVVIQQNQEALIAAFNNGVDSLKETLQKLIEQNADLKAQIASGQETMEGLMRQVLELIMQQNAWLRNISDDMGKQNESLEKILEVVSQIKNSVDTLQGLVKNIDKSININGQNLSAQLQQILNAIKSGNLSLDQIKQQMQILSKMLLDVIKNQNVEINISKDSNKTLAQIKQMLEQMIASGEVDFAKLMEILGSIESITKDIRAELKSVIDSLKQHYKNDTKIIKLLEKILAQSEANGNKADVTNQLLVNIQSMINKLGNKFDAAIGKILEAIANNGSKLDEIKKVLDLIMAQNENNQKEILAYIEKVGFDLNSGIAKLLAAIASLKADNNANHKELMAKLDDLLMKALKHYDDKSNKDLQAIINAMANIKLQGGTVDLSSVEAMLSELIALAKKNGNTLTSIDGKLDVLNITAKSIEDKLGKEFNKNDQRYKNIMAILQALQANIGKFDDQALLEKLDKIVAKLDQIIDLIKQLGNDGINVTVDVTGKVTCNCNCGSNHEGVLGDLNDILG